MRTLAILFILFYFLNALAVAPYGFKGQDQSTTLYSNVLQAPNSQVTNLGGINALIETGNKNILANASFEAPIVSNVIPSWVLGDSLKTNETSIVIDGKRSLKANFTGDPLLLIQDSTTYAAQFADGVQGIAMIRIKTSVAGLRVCPRSGGVTLTSICVSVVNNNKWGLYKVPFILGGTSNGISVNSNSVAVSGDFYFDDAFVGPAGLTQEMNACNSVSCETEFSAKISSTAVISDENGYDWLSTCTQSPTGTYTCNFTSGVFSLAPNCTVTAGGGTGGVIARFSTFSNTQIAINLKTDAGVAASENMYIICQKQGTDFTAAKQLSNGNTYSSTNSDTDWASCGLTGAAFTGFGSSVPTPSLQCKRQGADLLIKGTFQSGTTPTAVEARMALPTWNGVQLVSANSSIIPSVQLAGNLTINLSSATFFGEYVLIEPSVSYVTFGLQNSTSNAFSKATGSSMTGTGNSHSINARIPIEGWQNSNIIIGQFNGLESCTNSYECTDVFSAKISAAGIVSDENIDWISGNCTVSGTIQFSCLFRSNVFVSAAPNCVITPTLSAAANGGMAQTNSVSTSFLNYSTNRHDSALVAYDVQVHCQKGGADYIPKSAKAVASDQNLRMPGITNSKICSANIPYSAAYTLGKHYGSCVSSVNSSTGAITFNSGYWTDTPNCTCTAQGANTSVRNCYIDSGVAYNVNGVKFQTADGATNANNTFYFTCTGY